MKANIALILGVVAVVIAALAFVPAPKFGATNGGNVTNFTAVEVSDGYFINGQTVVNSAGAIVAAVRSVFDAGILHSYTSSTSTTATTYTLTQADILNYETVLMTPNGGAVTLTLPATSTITSMVPTAGDWQDQCWYNATSTAAATITFAAGTGIDLETASSSITGGAPVLSIGAGNTGCLKYIRKANTDIVVQFNRFVDGD